MSHHCDLVTHGDGIINLETIYQIGFEPGADNFAVMTEQITMPSKKLIVVQEKDSVFVSSFWEGDYSATSMVIYKNSDSIASTRTCGLMINHEIEKTY